MIVALPRIYADERRSKLRALGVCIVFLERRESVTERTSRSLRKPQPASDLRSSALIRGKFWFLPSTRSKAARFAARFSQIIDHLDFSRQHGIRNQIGDLVPGANLGRSVA